MPTIMDATIASNSNDFKQTFLSAGGLNLVCRVLREDFFPCNASYDIRQNSCLIALQLARFLLCGEIDDASSTPTAKNMLSSTKLQLTPTKGTGSSISPMQQSSMRKTISPSKPRSSVATFKFSSSPVKDVSTTATHIAAIQVLQTLCEAEFLEMITCFVRVCWAAAAGKLYLAANNSSLTVPCKKDVCSMESDNDMEVNLVIGRRRQSSAGNLSGSSISGEPDTTGLYLGACSAQKEVTSKDMLIACEALELLVTCLEVRDSKELAAFYQLSFVKGNF